MKKSIITLCLLLLCSILNAQKVSIGGELGFISSGAIGDGVLKLEKRRNSYYVGANVNYRLNANFEITSGLHYLRQGSKDSTYYIFEDGVDNELTVQLDYLIVPVAVNYYFGGSKRFVATFGFYGGLNVKAAIDYPERIGGYFIGIPRDISEFTHKYLFGGIVGVGYKIYESSKMQISPMFKYYQGISDISSGPAEVRYNSVLATLVFSYKI